MAKVLQKMQHQNRPNQIMLLKIIFSWVLSISKNSISKVLSISKIPQPVWARLLLFNLMVKTLPRLNQIFSCCNCCLLSSEPVPSLARAQTGSVFPLPHSLLQPHRCRCSAASLCPDHREDPGEVTWPWSAKPMEDSPPGT